MAMNNGAVNMSTAMVITSFISSLFVFAFLVILSPKFKALRIEPPRANYSRILIVNFKNNSIIFYLKFFENNFVTKSKSVARAQPERSACGAKPHALNIIKKISTKRLRKLFFNNESDCFTIFDF